MGGKRSSYTERGRDEEGGVDWMMEENRLGGIH